MGGNVFFKVKVMLFAFIDFMWQVRVDCFFTMCKAYVGCQLVRETGRAVDMGMALGSERFGV